MSARQRRTAAEVTTTRHDDLIVTLRRSELTDIITIAVAEALSEPQAHAPALLTANSLSDALGVSPRTVRRLTLAGMPTLMVADSPRFELEAVLQWLRDRNQSAGSANDSQTETAEFQPDSLDSRKVSV